MSIAYLTKELAQVYREKGFVEAVRHDARKFAERSEGYLYLAAAACKATVGSIENLILTPVGYLAYFANPEVRRIVDGRGGFWRQHFAEVAQHYRNGRAILRQN